MSTKIVYSYIFKHVNYFLTLVQTIVYIAATASHREVAAALARLSCINSAQLNPHGFGFETITHTRRIYNHLSARINV